MLKMVDKVTENCDKVSRIENGKMDVEVAESTFRKVTAAIKKLDTNLEHQKNEMNSFENWVEKYQPLRLQHQICQSVTQVLSKR